MFGNPLCYSLMSLVNLLFAAITISSAFYFNSYDEKEIPKYRQVLSERSPKYNTLEITITPKSKYYFVPSIYQKPVYKTLNTVAPENIPVESLSPTINPTEAPPVNLSKEDFILNEINNFRVSKGLSKSQTDSNTCNFAKLRAQEIAANFNHDGFTNRINDKTLPYSSYASITENISMNSDYKMVVPRWIESSGHADNMLNDTPYICIGSFGNYYAMEGWKP